jgi:nucleotide-binding universal stress UspA family protein
MITIHRILVPFDFSESSTRALNHAKVMAERFGATLDLMYVVPNPFLTDPTGLSGPLPPNLLDNLVADAHSGLDRALPPTDRERFKAGMVVKVGDARAEILSYAESEHVDLIVMGTHGRGGMAHLVLGSVAERIVRGAPCAVLTVR